MVSQHQSYDVEQLPGLFPLPPVGNGQFQKCYCKTSGKHGNGRKVLRPIDLQVITLFLQEKQNFIQL